MRNALAFLTGFALMVIVGCASIGVPTPNTFNERALAAYSTITGARDTATTLLTAGKITREDAINVQKQCDNAREAVDVARSLYATNPTGAADKLTATIAILQALNDYLLRKQS